MIETSQPTRVPLTALAEINPTTLTSSLSPDAEVSFIPMSDVTESGRWIGRQSRQYSEVRHGFTCFAEGDVLFAKITPCMENGKGCLTAGLINSIGFGSTEFHVLRARAEADAGFIYQWSIYQDLRHQAKNSMTGSAGQQRVPTEFFGKFLVPELPKPEQTKIAEILSTVDRAIEETEASIAKRQCIKTGLMQDLLTRGIDEHGNLRSETTHKFKDSPLGRIPLGWDVTNLGQIAEVIDPQPDHRTPPEVREGIPYIGLSEFTEDGTIDFDGARKISVAAFRKQQKAFLISEGDFVFGKIGTIGMPRRIPNDCEYALSANVILVKPKEIPSFVYWWIESPMAKCLVDFELHTTSQPAFGIQKMRSFPVPMPSKVERERVAAILDSMGKEKAILQRDVKKLRSLKAGLMQDLLTGNKRVTPLLEMELTI